MKMNKKDILVYIISVIFLMFISYCLSFITQDEIWNYGFSYNMAHGMIPYKDFNMVVGPLYNFIISLGLVFLPNHIFFFSLVNSLLLSIFFIPIHKKIGNSFLILILFMALLPITFSYNTFVSFLLIGILILEDSNSENKDIYIGLLISMMIMTKQNIGILIALFYLVKKGSKLKKIFSLMIPLSLFILILFSLNIGSNYIDFCFLGLGNFTNNFILELPSFVLLGAVLILLIVRFRKTKDIKIIYLLLFQIMEFPIIDHNHVLVGLLPVFYYYLLVLKRKEYFLLIKRLLLVIIILMNIRSFPSCYITIDSFIKYRKNISDTNSYILNMTQYVSEKEKEYKVYLFTQNAYLLRIQQNKTPSFYDLINQGNLGSNTSKYIVNMEEECKRKKCLFILDPSYFKNEKKVQLDVHFKEYVMKHYNYIKTLPSGEKIYTNDIGI